MTIKEQILEDPNLAFVNLINSKEQNEIFLQYRNQNLKNVQCLTTAILKEATRFALLSMHKNNQL